jgi:hypothetical protein
VPGKPCRSPTAERAFNDGRPIEGETDHSRPALRGFDGSQTNSLKLAQQQLGHSTLSTTANIYTSVDEEQVAETAEALGKAFCGRSVVEPLRQQFSQLMSHL